MNTHLLTKLQASAKPYAKISGSVNARSFSKSLVRFQSTASSVEAKATPTLITNSHPTAPLSSFNYRLARIFKYNDPPATKLPKILSVIEEIKAQNLKFDRNTYTSLLVAYANSRLNTKVLETLREMESQGIEPTIDVYNLILQGYMSGGNGKNRLEILSEMERKGISLTATSYYNILQAVAKRGELEHAFDIMDKMKENNIPMNITSYSQVINACVYVYESKGAFALLKEALDNGFSIETEPSMLFSVMRAAARNDEHEVVAFCWKKAVSENAMRPDEGTCLDAIRVAGISGNVKLATDVIQHLGECGYTYKEYYFTPLMEAFMNKGDLKNAFSVLDIMRASGIIPSSQATLPIRNHLGRKIEKIDEAYFILEELRKENKSVDVTAFNVILEACADARDVERTVATYREAAALGVTPNVDSYNAVLLACVNTRMSRMGTAVIDEMKKAGISPSTVTYTHMISLECTNDNYENAFKYLEEMKSYGAVPPQMAYVALVKKLAREADPRYLIAVEEMETFGYSVPPTIRKSWTEANEQ
ncbi:hypothetical protein CLU79DRAFT_727809 [Phycomyces nitens]|nr:hypothetical protein CLU79DRAFT_727809 [Phycomyces nitens]